MNADMETRHWAVMIGAVTLAIVAMIAIPELTPLYAPTVVAFPIMAIAVVLDTLGTAVESHRARLKQASWVAAVTAGVAALLPLRNVLRGMYDIYQSASEAGQPLIRSVWNAVSMIDQYSVDHRQAIAITFIVGVTCLGMAIAAPLIAAFDQRIRLNRQSRHGPWRARWMGRRDIARLVRNKTGLPLALHEDKLLRYAKNDAKGWRGGHHLVVSGTRGGKGVSAVIPAILDHQGPVVVLDIKGENFAVTRRHREELGRKVAVLNPFGLVEDGEYQFNPLDYIRPHELARDVALVADGLVKPEQGDGAHFSEMARKLVAAAIEVIVTQEEPNRRNLIAVADLLLSANLDGTLEAWAENSDLVGHRPAQTAATILRAGDRERGSIQTSVSKVFDWMQSDNMRHFLAGSSFSMDDLLDDRVDLFIAVPLDQVDKQAIFMRLFINLVLGTVVRQDGRRKVKAPILLVLDEFVRMGRMEQIMNIANVAAGAGVEALFVTQDTGQVETAYGRNDARSIFGSCITKRIFNINDIETAEWAARHLGDTTVYSQQVREGKAPNEGRDFSYSEQRQKLMVAEQIMGMQADEVLLLVGNRSPLKAKQNLYFKNPVYAEKFDPNPLQ